MTCPDYKGLMMGYLDNELDEHQKKMFTEHLDQCPECKKELAEFKELKQLADEVALTEPTDELWQQYWKNIYNRFERMIGWILMSVAAIILLVYGGFRLIEEIIQDPTIDMVLKIGLVALIVGVATLFVSVARERLYLRKKDPYKNIRR
ncbi:MAG: anti-sigma factor family protein [Planctomycetota bacterium]|jgi:predicted anti-sigma-YlaC factor YlaD